MNSGATPEGPRYPSAPLDPLDLISEGEEGSEVFMVSPEIAQRWLEDLNKKNRALKPPAVAGFVKLIKDGLWKKTHQGIAISSEMTLLDGQHRLSGIAGAGVEVPIRVTWGEDPDAFPAIDAGVKRTAGDTLYVSDLEVTNPNLTASVVRHVSYIKRGYGLEPFTAPELSISSARVEIELRALGAEKIQDSVVIGARYQNADIRLTGTVVGTSAHLISESGADTESMNEFFHSISSGLGIMESDDPRHALRRYLERRSKTTNTQRGRIETISTVIRSWNMWSTGKKAKHFRDPKTVYQAVAGS